MKKQASVLLTILVTAFISMNAQTISPDLYFDDEPGTHNMGIAFDGEFYYTCNGGKTNEGKISKYSTNGNFMQSYPLELDMRAIMFNSDDGHLYVNCYDGNIYKIASLEDGIYKLVYSELFDNEQASLAMGPKGRYLYFLDEGTLKVYDMKKEEFSDTFYEISCGPDIASGSCAVAVTKKHIITFNAEKKIFYLYDKKGKFRESKKYSQGDYGFSLSYANGHIFVAEDGNYGMGQWYGYESK
jgi:DNA-binding beta-propeller fold protein YncE